MSRKNASGRRKTPPKIGDNIGFRLHNYVSEKGIAYDMQHTVSSETGKLITLTEIINEAIRHRYTQPKYKHLQQEAKS